MSTSLGNRTLRKLKEGLKTNDDLDDGFVVAYTVVADWCCGLCPQRGPQFSQMKLAQNSQTPLEILKVRYARGQISREEFEQIHSDLQS